MHGKSSGTLNTHLYSVKGSFPVNRMARLTINLNSDDYTDIPAGRYVGEDCITHTQDTRTHCYLAFKEPTPILFGQFNIHFIYLWENCLLTLRRSLCMYH